MKKKGWSLTETIQFVEKRREIIQPNPGFIKQLIIFEGILNSRYSYRPKRQRKKFGSFLFLIKVQHKFLILIKHTDH